MLIAQISDLHLHASGLHFDLIDTAERVQQAFDYLHRLPRRPDVIVATGDLADKAEPEAYRRLRDIVDASDIPVFLLPGNHDERQPLVEAFPHHAYLPDPSGPLHYAIDKFEIRLVMFDTTVPGFQHGEVDDEGEAWLDAALAEQPDRPTVLAMHHPPFETGIWWMDQICLHGADRVERVVRRHPHVKLLIAGHIHRPIQTTWGGTLVSISPSTGLETRLDLEPESVPTFATEPPQLAMHLVDDRHAITHHTPFLPPEHVLRFTDHEPDWEKVKAFLRERGPIPKGGMIG